MIFTTSNPEPDPSPNFYIVFWQSSRLLPFSRSSAPSLIDSVLPPSISGFEDCIVLSFLGRKDTKRILEFFRATWIKENDGTKRSWMANLSIRTNFSKSIVEYFWNSFRLIFVGEAIGRRWNVLSIVLETEYACKVCLISRSHPPSEIVIRVTSSCKHRQQT